MYLILLKDKYNDDKMTGLATQGNGLSRKLVILLVIIINLFSSTAASSSDVSIIVSTEKTSYQIGDDIIITGKINEFVQNSTVVVRIMAPNGNLIQTSALTVQPDKSFSTIISTNDLWKNSGMYTVIAQWGSQDGSAETTFNFLANRSLSEQKSLQDSKPSMTEEAKNEPPNTGGLISTAVFGSELAPQVQLLRETRDNTVMKTRSGAAFMSAFNSVYYSFSPIVADWERQNPVFKEAVKLGITPLITTLSILNYVNIESEAEMMGYGIGIILLIVGMYFVAPAFLIVILRNRSKNKPIIPY